MSDKVLTLDKQGRLSIASRIRKNGIEPSALYRFEFGPNQTIILTPVKVVAA